MSLRTHVTLSRFVPWRHGAETTLVCLYHDHHREYLKTLKATVTALEDQLERDGWNPVAHEPLRPYSVLDKASQERFYYPPKELFYDEERQRRVIRDIPSAKRGSRKIVRKAGRVVAEIIEGFAVVDDDQITSVTAYRAPLASWMVAYASGGSEHNEWRRFLDAHLEARGFTKEYAPNAPAYG